MTTAALPLASRVAQIALPPTVRLNGEALDELNGASRVRPILIVAVTFEVRRLVRESVPAPEFGTQSESNATTGKSVGARPTRFAPRCALHAPAPPEAARVRPHRRARPLPRQPPRLESRKFAPFERVNSSGCRGPRLQPVRRRGVHLGNGGPYARAARSRADDPNRGKSIPSVCATQMWLTRRSTP